MAWTSDDFPDSMKNLPKKTREKAIDIANALLEDGYEAGRAIPIAISQAKEWADTQSAQSDYVQHVKKHREGWAVQRSDSSRASYVFSTKQKAVEKGRAVAQNQGVPLEVYGEDGALQDRSSFR